MAESTEYDYIETEDKKRIKIPKGMTTIETHLLTRQVKNVKRHDKSQINDLCKLIEMVGFKDPVIIDKKKIVFAGHGRLDAAEQLGMNRVPFYHLDGLTDDQKKMFILMDNRINESPWISENVSLLLDEVPEIMIDSFDLKFDDIIEVVPYDLEEVESLASKFGIPPFSVFDTRQGYWQKRKRQWIYMGIHSEEGRESDLMHWEHLLRPKYRMGGKGSKLSGTSVFDPVLTEICYQWFSEKGAKVFDPFSGGSVRGLVASFLGRNYTGVDLRKEQVDANVKQYELVKKNNKNKDTKKELKKPIWICGDSVEYTETLKPESIDFMLTSPPYYGVEHYSDLPKDLNNMGSYSYFQKAYEKIIKNCCKALKNNCFIAWNVGEVRDKKTGYLRNFVMDTINYFTKHGVKMYNDIILIHPSITLYVRAGHFFPKSRKLGRQHEYVLIFYKGNTKEIKPITERGTILLDEPPEKLDSIILPNLPPKQSQ